MGYHLKLSDKHSVYRKRGSIGLWERNEAYGYDAALDYVETMTLRTLDRWSEMAGITAEEGRAKYVAMIRNGGDRPCGMIPQPDFSIDRVAA